MLWLTAFPTILSISWHAGLFCPPRLRVRHAAAEDPSTRARPEAMKGRLYRFIAPSAILTLVPGVLPAVFEPS